MFSLHQRLLESERFINNLSQLGGGRVCDRVIGCSGCDGCGVDGLTLDADSGCDGLTNILTIAL